MRTPSGENVDRNGVLLSRDPMQDELLAALEELAQKTDLSTHWADDIYEAVKASPQGQFSLITSLFVVTDVYMWSYA